MFGNFQTTKYVCAIYTRVSTMKQVTDGYGLEAQLTKCEELIRYKGWNQYPTIYSDEGLSGKLDLTGRPQLKQLTEDAKKGLFNCVVFYSLDRLGRSTKIILNVIDILAQFNLKIVSCREHIDTTTASGELMLTFFAGMAQYEHRNIIERMKNGSEELRKKNGEKGGSVPLGYRRVEGGTIEINNEEADIVRMIFTARLKGMSMNKIADCLNHLEIKPRKGKKWYSSSVKCILDNVEKYTGGLRNNNVNGVCWPDILCTNRDVD